MASGKAFFMLRGVDSALWTAARQHAEAEGIKITDLIERLLVLYMNSEEELKQEEPKRAWAAKG